MVDIGLVGGTQGASQRESFAGKKSYRQLANKLASSEAGGGGGGDGVGRGGDSFSQA